MPEFTLAQVETIANSTLDFYVSRGKVEEQAVQEKPLLDALMSNKKTFPGGKEFLTGAVKGDYGTNLQGFANDDEVGYTNPANTKRYNYPFKWLHSGIKYTMDELGRDGISIVDTIDGKDTSDHSDRELTRLVDIFKEKIAVWMEERDRGFNNMFWGTGVEDTSLVPGIRSIIVTTPTAGTIVGGIDQSANTWWRNRASLALDAGTPANNVVTTKLQKEYRQLRRYGGNPKNWFAGSDFIEALEKELRASGTYTQDGFMSKGKTDTGMADISFKGNGIKYDPTLDDLSLSKYLYVWDSRYIYPRFMESEEAKKHYPARPENKYVFYRAMTDCLGLECNKRNAHGVYSIA